MCVVFKSDDLNHDISSVSTCINTLLVYIKDTLPFIKYISYFSDGEVGMLFKRLMT